MKFGQIGDLRDLAGNHPFRIVVRLPLERCGRRDPAMSTTDVSSPLPSAAGLSARSQQQPGRPRRPGTAAVVSAALVAGYGIAVLFGAVVTHLVTLTARTSLRTGDRPLIARGRDCRGSRES
jgi:hypothetical protein